MRGRDAASHWTTNDMKLRRNDISLLITNARDAGSGLKSASGDAQPDRGIGGQIGSLSDQPRPHRDRHSMIVRFGAKPLPC